MGIKAPVLDIKKNLLAAQRKLVKPSSIEVSQSFKIDDETFGKMIDRGGNVINIQTSEIKISVMISLNNALNAVDKVIDVLDIIPLVDPDPSLLSTEDYIRKAAELEVEKGGLKALKFGRLAKKIFFDTVHKLYEGRKLSILADKLGYCSQLLK